jgi:hypothetical protein
MDTDLHCLKNYLQTIISKIDNNNISECELKNLRNYYLDSLLVNSSNKELKTYLFIGYYILHNKDFLLNINEQTESNNFIPST